MQLTESDDNVAYEANSQGAGVSSESGSRDLIILPERSASLQLLDQMQAPPFNLIKTVWSLMGCNGFNRALAVTFSEPLTLLQRKFDQFRDATVIEDLVAVENDVDKYFLKIMRFYISTFGHIKQRLRKQFNPVLGETFQTVLHNNLHAVAEQVSHHPPISLTSLCSMTGHFKHFSVTMADISMGTSGVDIKISNPAFLETDMGTFRFEHPNLQLTGLLVGNVTLGLTGTSVISQINDPKDFSFPRWVCEFDGPQTKIEAIYFTSEKVSKYYVKGDYWGNVYYYKCKAISFAKLVSLKKRQDYTKSLLGVYGDRIVRSIHWSLLKVDASSETLLYDATVTSPENPNAYMFAEFTKKLLYSPEPNTQSLELPNHSLKMFQVAESDESERRRVNDYTNDSRLRKDLYHLINNNYVDAQEQKNEIEHYQRTFLKDYSETQHISSFFKRWDGSDKAMLWVPRSVPLQSSPIFFEDAFSKIGT